MNWIETVQSLDIEKVFSTIKKLGEIVEESRRSDYDFIQARHEDRCPRCGSHPVNHVKIQRTYCKKCGVSFLRSPIESGHSDFYKGKRVLSLQ